MIKVNLYEEFFRENLCVQTCRKTELKDFMHRLSNKAVDVTDNSIIRIRKSEYEVYYRNLEYEGITVRLDPVARSRIETEFEKLDDDMKRFDEALRKLSVTTKGDKYCLIKQMDVEDDYLIIDVYVEMKEWRRNYG